MVGVGWVSISRGPIQVRGERRGGGGATGAGGGGRGKGGRRSGW